MRLRSLVQGKFRLRLKNNLVTGDWKNSHLHACASRGKEFLCSRLSPAQSNTFCRRQEEQFFNRGHPLNARTCCAAKFTKNSAADDKRSSIFRNRFCCGRREQNSHRILLRTTRGAPDFATNSAADDEKLRNEFCCGRREERPTSRRILLRTTRGAVFRLSSQHGRQDMRTTYRQTAAAPATD